MDNRYKINKTKCKICGRTIKKILTKDKLWNSADFVQTEEGEYICKYCEREYRVTGNYSERGYGYKYSTEPKKTAMDTLSTPTFGIEIEVAGNIQNIGKIDKITEQTHECSIGYDTSVEGAQFELSYAPGTYYWYLYESKLQAVCNLLEKDKWTKDSETIGNHIHVGNIRVKEIRDSLLIESEINPYFWKILKAMGERFFNTYCENIFRGDHHDAISMSRWGTLEFRFFKGTYNFQKIMARMRFIRQLIDNAPYKNGVNWENFKPEVKKWCIEQIEKSGLLDEIEKQHCKECFEGKFKKYEKTEEEKQRVLDEFYEEVEEDEEEDW